MNNEVTHIPVQRSQAAQAYLNALFLQVRDYFDESDMRTVCFRLGMNYDDLGGRGRAANIRELLIYLAQNGNLPDLIDICRRDRPAVDWPDPPPSVSQHDLMTAARPKPVTKARYNQLILLERVYQFWIEGVLECSVHHEAFIELNKREMKTAVSHNNPWQMVLTTPAGSPKQLPPGASIFDIFMEMDQALLILGEPGAGKTITLLELARDLIDQAYMEPVRPIPVVFTLSTWRGQPFIEWLTDELHLRYKIPKATGQTWVEQGDLLLLLDGLDEVVAAHREACIKAINAYQADYGLTGIAVCSRTQEYKASGATLALNGAVQLEALTPEQVDDYLQRLGDVSQGLRRRLSEDPALQELTRTPLMLSVMTVAYRESPGEEPAVSETKASHQPLFDVYVKQLLTRHHAPNGFTPQQTISWLHCLAQKLRQHEQTEFFMEELQPSWLPERKQRVIHIFLVRLVVVLLFALALSAFTLLNKGLIPAVNPETPLEIVAIAAGRGGLVVLVAAVLILIAQKTPTWLAVGITAVLFTFLSISFLPPGSITAVLYGLAAGGTAVATVARDQIKFKTVNLAWKKAIWGILIATIGLLGIIFVEGNIILSALTVILFLLGLLSTIPLMLVGRNDPLDELIFPNQGVHKSAKNAVKLGGIVLLMVFLTGLLLGALLSLLTPESLLSTIPNSLFVTFLFGLPIALIVALFYGGTTVIQFTLLRIQLTRTGALPWQLVSFLDYTTRCVFLQQVGGGYIFIHSLFLDYFADPQLPERRFV